MEQRQKVMATDFDMQFLRKAEFTIKREVAAIPAEVILIIAWFILSGALARIILRP